MTVQDKELEIRVEPKDLHDSQVHRLLLAKQLGISEADLPEPVLIRRSLDARRGRAVFLLRFMLGASDNPLSQSIAVQRLSNVATSPPVIIVGCGPAGLFAALRLIELGLKPVMLERGKAVRDRRRDIASLTKRGEVNPDSNYCFGEGGAGTFSDGKLYTRAHKRGSVERILQILEQHGAASDILVDAHPHIGTNRLPAVVEKIRETILSCGGEIHFNQRASEIVKNSEGFEGVKTATGEVYRANALLLATGHSARDVFHFLHAAGVQLEAKPFALGVRVEHPQALINSIQYGRQFARQADKVKLDANLPSAAYALRAQCNKRGVFSFCMCPGGIICPAATAPSEIVVNGWSPSKRNSRFANSGIVVEVPTESLSGSSIFAGIEFQQKIEQRAFELGGGKQVAPAQRLADFVEGRVSQDLPESSYLPGIRSADLRELFPAEISDRLALAFKDFGKQMRGYFTNEAVLVGPESRTSSPIRTPRDKTTLMHPGLAGLFPCGEGAGFAGGIVSAAMDGERCAEAVARYLGLNDQR